jgi:hypothetical protein
MEAIRQMTKEQKIKHSINLAKAAEQLASLEIASHRLGLTDLAMELKYIRGNVEWSALVLRQENEK